MTAIDRATAEDMVCAMALLRGRKSRRDERWTDELQAIENSYRRFVSPSITERTASASDVAASDDSTMQTIWVTTKQTAETLQISEGLVRKRIREGHIHAVREGRLVRIHRDELERYVQSKEMETANE